MKYVWIVALVACGSAWAQPGPGSEGSHREPPAELKAAFDACKASGAPGSGDFHLCMESKGFKRPEPPPAMKAAFEACKSNGTPGVAAFDQCMASKGFKRPERGERPDGHPRSSQNGTTGNPGQPSTPSKSLVKSG